MSRKKKPTKGKPSDAPVGRGETVTASRNWPVKFTLLLLILICSAAGVFLYKSFSRTLPLGFPALPDVTQASPVVREVLQRADANARVHPDSAEAWGSLAMTYHANQFFENAKLAYQLAARSDPNDYRWF